MGQEPKPSSKSARSRSGSPVADAVTQGKKAASSVELIGFAPSVGREGHAPQGKKENVVFFRRATVRWIAAIALVGSVLFLAPGVYRGIKDWRARALALQSEDFVKKKQFEEAINSIRSGYMLSPNNPEIIRSMAQLYTAIASPDATTYWNWLLQTPDATDDDRRAAIDSAMQNNLFNKASIMIRDLLARNGRDSRNQLIAARWSAERGTPDDTMAYATRAVDDDPANKAAVLFLGTRELNNKYLHQEGVNTLLQLAGSDDDSGLAALRQLASDPNLEDADIDRLIVRLHSHPLSDESERLDALVLEIKRHPGQRELLIDRAVAAHQNVVPEDLALFCEWLTTNNEAPRVLKLIPRERALSNKSLCFTYLDCLAELKRWDDIKSILTGTTVPLEASLVELYLSRCADVKGETQSSDLHWKNAVDAAAYNPVESLRLADYAENHGQKERAADLYRTLTQQPVTARIAYLGLVRILSDKDFRTRRDLLDQVVSRWPKDAEMVSQDILLNLLLNERVPEMHEHAVRLFADDSYNISLRTNVALSCLRLKDPAGALQAYNNAEINWNNVPVVDLVVYAATLNANGHGDTAHRLLFLVNRHALRPELRDLIKSVP